MKVVVAGASGLIGKALCARLGAEGHQVCRLVRSQSAASADDVAWDPSARVLNPKLLEGADAIVCLSGANIGSGRWTAAKKRAIRESRVETVGLLAASIQRMKQPPRAFVTASAVGYYGAHLGATLVDETHPPGDDFLARVCVDWEAAAQPAIDSGVRVVHARFGPVLDAREGVLAKMLPVYKLGLGGVIGDGKQYFSWIALDDAVAACTYALTNESIHGPMNVVSPHPVTNRELTKTLGRILRRPTWLPMPAVAVRAAFGEMGATLLLGSIRAEPRVLQASGFQFRVPELADQLSTLS